MITLTLSKDWKLKNALLLEGEVFEIEFHKGTPAICTLRSNINSVHYVKVENLPEYFEDLEPKPDLDELKHMVCDSVVRSVLGDDVEPDGWDENGSPSWLIAMELI